MGCLTCGNSNVTTFSNCDECKGACCNKCSFLIDKRDKKIRNRYKQLKKYYSDKSSNPKNTVANYLFKNNDVPVEPAGPKKYDNKAIYKLCAKCFYGDRFEYYKSDITYGTFSEEIPEVPLNINLLRAFYKEVFQKNDVIVFLHNHDRMTGVEQLMIDFIKCFGPSDMVLFMEGMTEIPGDYSKDYLVYKKMFEKKFGVNNNCIDIINSYTHQTLDRLDFTMKNDHGKHVSLLDYIKENNLDIPSFSMEDYITSNDEIAVKKQMYFKNYKEFEKNRRQVYALQTGQETPNIYEYRTTYYCNQNIAKNVKRTYDLINMEKKNRFACTKVVIMIGLGHHGPYSHHGINRSFTQAIREVFPSSYKIAMGKALGHSYMQQLMLPRDKSQILAKNKLDFHINFQNHDGICHYDNLFSSYSSRSTSVNVPFDMGVKFIKREAQPEFIFENL
ncbi:MAG: hypothetical protein GY750_01210 [Lentisphaerae bacterium]|nr:hypothetical protein [Lentisphaerota bacterium]MCP4100037.1 hypothetical protein [Lentisphaerota bacterium]